MSALTNPRVGMAIAGFVVGLSLLARFTRGPAQVALLVLLCAALAILVIIDFTDRGARALLGVAAIGTAVVLTGITGSLIPLAAIIGAGFLPRRRATL